MPQAIDLTGKRFGRWVVIDRAENYRHKKGYCAAWNCVCDCGTERVVLGNNLLRGKSLSCGCYKDDFHRKRCNEEKREIHYRTLNNPPDIETILHIILEDDYENTPEDKRAEAALQKVFYNCWFKYVRDEQSVMRRHKRGHPTCEICGKECETVLHHKIPVSEYGGNEPENIMWICKECHKKIEIEKMMK